MDQEIWSEICYLLNETVPSNVSEQLYESKVVQVFEKLGWSQYKSEISVRETIPFGANNRMHPDLVLRTQEKENLFVVEVKKPSENLDHQGFEDQLSSYMRILKMRIGILLGKKIKIFVDNSNSYRDNILLIDEIPIDKDSKKGIAFVEGFKKTEDSIDSIDRFVQNRLNHINAQKAQKALMKHLETEEFHAQMKDFIKVEMLNRYSEEVIDSVLGQVEISLKPIGFQSQDLNQNPPHNKTSIKRSSSPDTISNLESKKTKDGLKIGSYVQKTFKELFKENKLSSNDIQNLLSQEYSKRMFKQPLPVLRLLSQGTSDHKGRNRYYTRQIYDGKYYLNAQWNVVHWDYFEDWLKSIKPR